MNQASRGPQKGWSGREQQPRNGSLLKALVSAGLLALGFKMLVDSLPDDAAAPFTLTPQNGAPPRQAFPIQQTRYPGLVALGQFSAHQRAMASENEHHVNLSSGLGSERVVIPSTPGASKSLIHDGDLLSLIKQAAMSGGPSLSAGPSDVEPFGQVEGAIGAEPSNIWTPELDAKWREIAPHPSLTVFLGPRGSGKTAQAYRVLELQRDRAAPYVVGLPPGSLKLLPQWMGLADRVDDVPRGAAILVDEAYLTYGARSSMSRQGRTIGEVVNLSRQRQQSLLFVTQSGRALDIDIMGHADVIAIKGVSELGSQFERREIRGLLDKAQKAFAQVTGDPRRWTWVYSEKAGFEGMVKSELPSFWKPALSHAYADIARVATESSSGGGKNVFRAGSQTSRHELAATARAMRAAGKSYGEIAKALGVSKSTAWELVNGSGRP